MSVKKYELLKDDYIEVSGVKLYRIRALIPIRSILPFGIVEQGDLGGYIQCEENLSHEGKSWVFDNAKVYGEAKVSDNADLLQ